MQFKLPVQTAAKLRQLADRAPFNQIVVLVHNYPIADPIPSDGIGVGLRIQFEWSKFSEPRYVCLPWSNVGGLISAECELHLIFEPKSYKFEAEWKLAVMGRVPLNAEGKLFLDAGTKLLQALHTHLTTIGTGHSIQVLEVSGLNPYISHVNSNDNRGNA